MADKKTCTYEDCPKPKKARGLCSMHWSRWQKYGDPGTTKPIGRPAKMWWEK